MEKEQKSNLAKTAIALLKSDINFDMSYYLQDKDKHLCRVNNSVYQECGTSCCFAGYGPAALGNGIDGEGWISYLQRTFTTVSPDFNFLFHFKWPNDKQQAAARAAEFLENGCPTIIDYNKTWPTNDLLQRLKKFV